MNTKTKILLGLAVILALGVTSIYVVKADTYCYPSSSNCVLYAQGYHTVINNAGSYWSPTIYSKTVTPPINIDDIGYGWWNAKHSCNGTWLWGTTVYGGVLHNTSLYYASMTIPKPACVPAGARVGYSGGSHDFYDWPYSHLYFNTSATGGIP